MVYRRVSGGFVIYLFAVDGEKLNSKADTWGIQRHTVVKDVAVALLYAEGYANAGGIATEVTLPRRCWRI